MSKIKIGIFGAGRIGQIHIHNLVQMTDVKLEMIADPFLKDISSLNLPYEVQVVEDGNEIIENPDIDAVFICSPTDTHIGWIEKAAKAGKHIFCEKPISASDDKTLEAYQIVKENDIKFQIGVNRRFDRNFATIRKYVEDNRAGNVQLLRIDSRDPEAPPLSYVKVSGGLFFDMMIHDFDMARFIVGSEVEEVYATGDALINPEIRQYKDIDTAIVTLKFKNGTLGVISNSRQAVYGYDQRVEVFGDKGAIKAENELSSQVTVSDVEGVHTEKPLHFFLERYAQAYYEEVVQFIEAVKNNTETPVSFKDGIMAQRLAFAAQKSLETGLPVKVDLLD